VSQQQRKIYFVIKRTIYSKSADIFISLQSTHTAINCGTQYLTNVHHDSAGTLLLFFKIFKSCALVGTPYIYIIFHKTYARCCKIILKEEHERKRPLGRPRCGWEVNIKMNLKQDCRAWTGFCRLKLGRSGRML
jgi:hypothetical protein